MISNALSGGIIFAVVMSVGGVAADRIEVSRNPTLEVRARELKDVLEDL